MARKKALLLLGGAWHDFDGFAGTFASVLERHGWGVAASYELDRLTHLTRDGVELVLAYTCFAPGEGAARGARVGMDDRQIRALTRWVRAGGALVATHASTVLGDSDPALGVLIGGVFIEHPPAFSFTVHPVRRDHPITAGLAAFRVHDEMYVERCEDSVEVLMVARRDGIEHPLAWCKREQQGRVAHVALGHAAETWKLKPYQQLILQAVEWSTRRGEI